MEKPSRMGMVYFSQSQGAQPLNKQISYAYGDLNMYNVQMDFFIDINIFYICKNLTNNRSYL